MLGRFNPETRSFNTRGWGPKAISYLSGVSEGETIHELYFQKVLAYARKEEANDKVKAAAEEFLAQLKEPFIPHPNGITLAASDLPTYTPAGTRPYPWQRSAVLRMVRGSMLLGDDMGLGKTLTALWAWWLLNLHRGKDKFLPLTVVSPNDAVSDEWVIALEEHFGLRKEVYHVKKQLPRDAWQGAVVIIIPYSRYWRDGYYRHLEARVRQRSVLIFDEAHRLSEVSTRQHHFAWHLATANPFRWCLSGSEVSNTPLSYYGPYRIITRSRLASDPWVHHCFDPWTKGWKEGKIRDIHTLRKAFAIRRTRDQIGHKLPPLTEITRRVELDPVSREIYNGLQQEANAEIQTMLGEEKTITPVNWMVVHLRLLQLCSHPSLIEEGRVDESHKFHTLVDIVDEAYNQKMIIWSNFPKAILWLQLKLKKLHPKKVIEVAYGGVAMEERNRIKREMQAGRVDILIANPAVWAEGVNLTAATINIYWDFHASRTRWVQSKQRSHRIGQTKPVTIYYLAVKGSVEEKLIKWLNRKTELAQLITGN